MKTFYEILEINKEATDNEIIKAFENLSKKYENDEKKLKEVNIAKMILLNKEARENYDQKLKEMEEAKIFSNINQNTENYNEEENQVNFEENDNLEENIKEEELNNINVDKEELVDEDSAIFEKPIEKIENNKKENYLEKNKEFEIAQKKLKEIEEKEKKEREINEKLKKKEQKTEKRKQEKLQKKQEKLKDELYKEAYAKYLKSLGYDVKMPWTWKRIKNLLITILGIIVACIVLWCIPPFRNGCKQLYSENAVIRMFVNIIGKILEIIADLIKSLFKVGD